MCILKRYKGEGHMNKTKIKKILDKHRLWIKTEGEEGERADLSEEVLSGEDLRGVDLRFADLNGVNLEGADLKSANLMGADLSDSDLLGANFFKADLSGANLGGADFEGADLRGANLEGANLSGANLKGADLKQANFEYSSFPLWSGGIDVNIDDAQALQLLYFLLKNVSYSKNISNEFKMMLLKNDIVSKANEFYMAKECGKIQSM